MGTRTVSRVIASAALAGILLASVAACALPFPLTDTSDEVQSQDEAQAQGDVQSQDNAQALEAYVGLEQAGIADILAQYPGVYEKIQIEGSFEELPDVPGEYAVVFYDYVYADPMDHASTAAALEGEAAGLQDTCDTAIFPSMRQTGVTGPLGAQYTFYDGDGEIWSFTCTDEG